MKKKCLEVSDFNAISVIETALQTFILQKERTLRCGLILYTEWRVD